MSDNERVRDRDRRGRGKGNRRSRSPRRDRGGGGRRERYRSRSPLRNDERESGRAGRGAGGRGRGREDRERAPPTGPRGAPPARSHDARPSNSGPVKPPTGPRGATADSTREDEKPDVEMKEDRSKPDNMDEETWEMQKTMGFAGFKSTKNTKVPGNSKNYGVRKDKQMEARQYMNRQGGFNRPLSPSRG